MILFPIFVFGLSAADGLYRHTQNAISHYSTGYYNRMSPAPSRTNSNNFSKFANPPKKTPAVPGPWIPARTIRRTIWRTRFQWWYVLGSMFAKMRAEEERNARIALNYQNQRKSAGEKPQNTPTDDAKARRDANHKYGSPFKPHLNYQEIFSSLFQANHKSNVILAKVLSLLSILYRFVFCSKWPFTSAGAICFRVFSPLFRIALSLWGTYGTWRPASTVMQQG